MANPQPTPFVQLSKELLDALLLSPMPPGCKEIVLAIIRCTYGTYGKKAAPVSISLLQSMTGRDKKTISQRLKALRDENVIEVVSPPNFSTPTVYRLNKDYEAWGKWRVPALPSVDYLPTAPDMPTGGEKPTPTGGEKPTPTGGVLPTIEDIKKTLETPPIVPHADFDVFWQSYPRKVGKGAARRAYASALKKTDPETLLAALKAQLPTMMAQEERFIPHAATWLNGERWADEVKRPKTALELVDEYWGARAMAEEGGYAHG